MHRALETLETIRTRLAQQKFKLGGPFAEAHLVSQQAAILRLCFARQGGRRVSLARVERDTRVAEYCALLGQAALGLTGLLP